LCDGAQMAGVEVIDIQSATAEIRRGKEKEEEEEEEEEEDRNHSSKI